jgi:hypothetical protein
MLGPVGEVDPGGGGAGDELRRERRFDSATKI